MKNNEVREEKEIEIVIPKIRHIKPIQCPVIREFSHVVEQTARKNPDVNDEAYAI